MDVCFDNIAGYFRAGELAVIAARPAMGKTTFALGLAEHMAVKNGVPTAFFSLELSKEQAAARISLPSGELGGAPLFIDDTPAMSVRHVCEELKRLTSSNGVKLTIVDYLQLLRRDKGNIGLDMRCVSRELKSAAEDLNIVVVVLSQLSREPEKRSDHRPRLSDFSDSGVIVKYADFVAFLYREENRALGDGRTGATDFIIAKNRDGAAVTIPLI